MSAQSQDGEDHEGIRRQNEPEIIFNAPQQEGAPEGKDIANYNLDVDYGGSEPKVEPVAQEQKEVDPDAEYVKNGNCQKRDPLPEDDALGSIHGDHKAWVPEIMALWLQDMYIKHGFRPEAKKLLIKEQDLDNLERLTLLNNKNVNDICNVMRKQCGKNANGMPNRWQQVSVVA